MNGATRIVAAVLGVLLLATGGILLPFDLRGAGISWPALDVLLILAGMTLIWMGAAGPRARGQVRWALVRVARAADWLMVAIARALDAAAKVREDARKAAEAARAEQDVEVYDLKGRSEFYTKIRGVTRNGRQSVVARLRPGNSLRFRREPGNPADPNAIAVVTRWLGSQVGYLSREWAATLAPRIDAGEVWVAEVTDVTGGGRGESLGCNIHCRRV